MKSQNPPITDSIPYQFSGVTIYAEFSDTVEGFAFRLRAEDNTASHWCWAYDSLATLHYNTRTFILGTCYGHLPKVETPFEVFEGIRK